MVVPEEPSAKKSKTNLFYDDDDDEQPKGVDLPADTRIRVRNSEGVKVIKVHSTDTLKRLLFVVIQEFGLKAKWKEIELCTMMPKVFVSCLNPDSLVKEHGLNGSSLVLSLRES
jgi:hypothetical protein